MKDNESLLRQAADNYDVDAARSLIQAGADVNGPDDLGRTALHFATDLDYPQECYDVSGMIDLLIRSGAKVNAATSNGWTPLHFAAFRLDQRYLEWLINAGADVILRNDDGHMPIHIPLDYGRIDDVRFLVQFYEDNDIDIFIASMIGRIERVTQILDESPKQANSTDNYGSTPLMTAAFHNQVDVVNLLLIRGAEPNVQNQGGITALHISRHPAIIELLLSNGADPTIRDIEGAIPSLP